MSQQPPPYGPQPPYGMPPGELRPSGMSNKAKFWIGAVLAIPAVIAGPVLIAAAVNLGQVAGPDSATSVVLGGLAALLLLVGFVVLVLVDRTRWIGLGMLAGFAGLFILGAGACVALIAAYNNSV